MKLWILSDLHTEFAPFDPPTVDADMVILAGDIGLGLRAIEFAKSAFGELPVLFVAGNHEYYKGAIPDLTHAMREACANTTVHLMEDDMVTLGGVRFLGSTLWTDYAVLGADRVQESMNAARMMLNDHRLIRHGEKDFSPEDALATHRRSANWLEGKLKESDELTVVITHHAPSIQSCPPQHKDSPLNPAFHSDLEWMMGKPAFWIHGHTHHCVDYVVRGTRVVSNQRGYPHEPVAAFRPDCVVEVTP